MQVDCLTVHAINWQAMENLMRHGHSIHLWAQPVEFVCAMFAFIAMVFWNILNKSLDIALAAAAVAYCNFASYWVAWTHFASIFVAHLMNPRPKNASVLPLIEQPVMIRFCGDSHSPHYGCYGYVPLFSLNSFGFDECYSSFSYNNVNENTSSTEWFASNTN
jgi:hypothetical protein